ncbi:hypothetical protein DLM78_18150 [Leptospira stimsonii]|uniref:Uncharacterized protein n=1 Tax=Leptospira stimsonii TaxID=2202203 RepID=A0A8B3CL90_9LEPT|nr:hypothetical protein DLM78_18150 [Leptospira stimsonii]
MRNCGSIGTEKNGSFLIIFSQNVRRHQIGFRGSSYVAFAKFKRKVETSPLKKIPAKKTWDRTEKSPVLEYERRSFLCINRIEKSSTFDSGYRNSRKESFPFATRWFRIWELDKSAKDCSRKTYDQFLLAKRIILW